MRHLIRPKPGTFIFGILGMGWVFLPGLVPFPAQGAAILDQQKLLESQTFWDNRDWDWYRQNIPFFECPDPEINATYYYRWELVTKHLTYGSPNSGYNFTEFIDRPFWSGAYGSISCPSGHQLYETRWLKEPRYARDYARYWFRTPGAQPRRYSCWLADALWAVQEVHPEKSFVVDFLPDLIRNYEAWEKDHFVPEVGLFWQIGHDDGMEYNINSRQTQDIVRGGPGFRPSFNAYMWADALAIARIAELAGDGRTARTYRAKAAGLKKNLQKRLWDPNRHFFFPMSLREETDQGGHVVKAHTLTYQSGPFAGSQHGREEIGYVPWQFGLPDPGYEAAWKFLMDRNYFFADYGPTTVERHDPMFYLSKTCCWWSGMSWPYATTQTLKGLAHLLQNYDQNVVTRADYFRLLRVYTLTHHKEGRPYLAEAAHPDTGSFAGHDSYNHSEHYFHSGYNDLIITGLIGLKPRADDVIEIDPLAPAQWEYFALDDVAYHGRRLAILWDKLGTRYGFGPGLHLVVDGTQVASASTLGKLSASLPPPAGPAPKRQRAPYLNYAVNNEGTYYPKVTASYSNPQSPASFVQDGNYWYHLHPPNRWTSVGSASATDWLAVDFGVSRPLDTVKLYFLDDGRDVVAPAGYQLEYWKDRTWKPVTETSRTPRQPTGHRANVVRFDSLETSRLRAVFTHAASGRTGLTEFETWGEGSLPYTAAPPPAGNLALNRTGAGFPKASASFSDRYGGVPRSAIDGRIVFRPTPMNRWTSYGSTNRTDWLEVDFGQARDVGRISLYIYDDRGGVQAPAGYTVQYWTGREWREAEDQVRTPAKPAGGNLNTVTFRRTLTPKLRVVFVHQGNARSGVTELEAWEE
jgi:Mannosylglycerate hydrolase MGH1-like glycoside hydrolase domain/NedA-like, galactose-binding domain/F5/8 type C domain/Glycosyl hydrolase family 65, C-terminal domain